MGLAAVVVVAATVRHTREQIWAPPATERRERLRHSTRHMLVATSAVALLFAIVGSWTGDRCLVPIAVSHAVLGTTYYYWIRGDDLLLRWFSATRWLTATVSAL